ncbi:MAG: ribulose-phosphate 3-epimerase [Planctomycetota bacterium]
MTTPMPLRIAPSILSSDFARLAEELARLEAAGADWVHVDVMDGHFVPNLTIGPPVVRAIKRATKLPLDVHIMISEPDRYAEAFCEAGADFLTFHVEATDNAAALCERIRRLGVTPGVAIKPGTSLSGLDAHLEAADLILIMTVEPGFGGQSFMHGPLDKVRAVYERYGGHKEIQVDGGVNAETVKLCSAAGANAIVAGSFVFKAEDLATPIDILRRGWRDARTEQRAALSHSLDNIDAVE